MFKAGLLAQLAILLLLLLSIQAGNIPYIGFIFKGAGYMMKAIKTVLKNLKDKSKQIKVHVVPKFSRPVNLATDALSKVQEQVGDYSTLVVGLTTLRAPQCMEDLIAGLASFNPYTGMSLSALSARMLFLACPRSPTNAFGSNGTDSKLHRGGPCQCDQPD